MTVDAMPRTSAVDEVKLNRVRRMWGHLYATGTGPEGGWWAVDVRYPEVILYAPTDTALNWKIRRRERAVR